MEQISLEQDNEDATKDTTTTHLMEIVTPHPIKDESTGNCNTRACTCISHTCTVSTSAQCYAGLEQKRKAIKAEAEKVLSYTQEVTDTHILDHTIATLSQLSTSLLAHLPSSTSDQQPTTFVDVEKFAPAQKNEPQIQFKRTTSSAGRKQKIIPLK